MIFNFHAAEQMFLIQIFYSPQLFFHVCLYFQNFFLSPIFTFTLTSTKTAAVVTELKQTVTNLLILNDSARPLKHVI